MKVGWPALVAGALFTAACLSGFLQGFVLFLALPLDLGAPFGMTIDQYFADGGVVLGDQPGNGVTVDDVAIAQNQRTATWLAKEGPHVRSRRAGLRLVADSPAKASD